MDYRNKFAAIRLTLFSLSVLAVLLSACKDKITVPPPGPEGKPIYAIDVNNTLIRFGSMTPGTVTQRVTISGLQIGEKILGIDFRPVDQQLYALGSTNRIYVLDTLSGAATQMGTTAFSPTLSGTTFGFDFNPTADRLRVHGDDEQNLRLNQLTGQLAALDSVIAFAAGDARVGTNPNLAGTAYTNSVVNATTTALFAIDSDFDILVSLPSPNNGKLVSIGALGVNTTDFVGFDIAGNDGTAYASLTVPPSGISGLYTVNLSNGSASFLGTIGNNAPLLSLAIKP